MQQISQLANTFRDAGTLVNTPERMEFLVPLFLSGRTTPLLISVVVLKNFPVQVPILTIKEKVVHKDVSTHDYTYIGAGIK